MDELSSPLSSMGAATPTLSCPSSPSPSSSVLSEPPSSPSPPSSLILHQEIQRYPSPMSSIPSPVKLGQQMDDNDTDLPAEGPSPAKKRKTMAPKQRTTEYVDLIKPYDDLTAGDKLQMDRLVEVLRKKKKIVVVAGAGISVSAGIPDFRSSTGLFATAKSQHKLKSSGKQLFDASVYRHNSSTESFHAMVRSMDSLSRNAVPTPFHHLLASLAQEGRLLRLYSQNIDCLDTGIQPLATNVPLNVKGPWPATVQLHGSLEKMVCTKCGNISPFESSLFDGPEAPLCKACEETDQVRTAHAGKRSHGIGRLRPRFVLYNEYNPDEEAIGNVSSADLKARPDAVIVVGTTLKVPGTRRLVKELCQVARGRRDGFTAWINIDSAPKGVEFRDCWDLVVRSKCDDVAREVALPPWDCHIGDDYLVSEEEDVENQKRKGNSILEVNLPSSHSDPAVSTPRSKKLEGIQGILTPQPSPKIAAVKQPGKSRQIKLPFGNAIEVEQTRPKAPKSSKSRRRQPKPMEPVLTNRTVTEVFKTVKHLSVGTDGGKNKGEGTKGDEGEGEDEDEDKAEEEEETEKKDVFSTTQWPEVHVKATASFQNELGQWKRNASERPDALVPETTENMDEIAIQRSTTPSTTTPTPVGHTISPNSAPRGMQELIDMGGR